MIKSIKKAYKVFVLSKYAQLELMVVYEKKSYVLQGAIKKVNLKLMENNPLPVNEELIILSICRLEKTKRVDIGIKAFKRVLLKVPNARLLIGGTGPEYNYLSYLIKKHKLQNNVTLIGYVPDKEIVNYYTSADLFSYIGLVRF